METERGDDDDKMKDKMMVNENGDDAWQDEWEMTLTRILVDDCDFDGHDDRWTCCDETGCLGWYMYLYLYIQIFLWTHMVQENRSMEFCVWRG